MKDYIFIEYPKYLCIDNEEIIVHNKEEELKFLKSKGVKNEPASTDNSEGLNPQINEVNRSIGRGRKSK